MHKSNNPKHQISAPNRRLIALIMLLLGIIAALLSDSLSGLIETLLQSLGLSLIVTGIVTGFQEIVSSPAQQGEVREYIDKTSNEVRDHINKVSSQSQENFGRVFGLLRGPGIYMLSPERRGHSRYHKWVIEKYPQEIFFAGHSVLHRAQADFESLSLLPVHEALKRKVSEGSRVHILFLDPTWSFIDEIARNQGQDPDKLRADLAKTLSICRRLWDSLANERLAGDIDIRTCRELKQYAFHHVKCRDRNENEMLVGFYFAGKLGMKSPLFIVENEQIQESFEEHFKVIFERAKKLLMYSREGDRYFDQNYYRDCQNALDQNLDE